MKQKSGVSVIYDACRRNSLNRILEKYIRSCREATQTDGAPTRRAQKQSGKFPNLAGFCRFYGISIDELEGISSELPHEISQLYAILEDEALNSSLPPAVLSAYLKKRLGYDKDAGASDASRINGQFEHDVFRDGE